MPEVTGEQAAQTSPRGRRDGKVLFITGYSDLETLKGAEVLQKPFEPQELVRRLAELEAPQTAASR